MRPIPLRELFAIDGKLYALSMDGRQLFEKFSGPKEQWHPFPGPTVERKRNASKARRRSRNR
jgi:hypothetical protein